MLAAAEVARHAYRLRIGIDHDHRVRPVFVTAAAMILDGLPGPVLS
jgi:predicted dehydrogenase